MCSQGLGEVREQPTLLPLLRPLAHTVCSAPQESAAMWD